MLRDGGSVERTHYLMISAIAVDTRPGACVALQSRRCSIYERRPLACRSVPLHYCRPGALAERDFDAFVRTPEFRCDSSGSAPIVLEGGRIVDPTIENVRAQALAMTEGDRTWKNAIVRRMKGGAARDGSLPSLQEVEANAAFGALTTSMRIGWEIAAADGLITQPETERLVELQLQTTERELASGSCTGENIQTLADMALEYREALAP